MLAFFLTLAIKSNLELEFGIPLKKREGGRNRDHLNVDTGKRRWKKSF